MARCQNGTTFHMPTAVSVGVVETTVNQNFSYPFLNFSLRNPYRLIYSCSLRKVYALRTDPIPTVHYW